MVNYNIKMGSCGAKNEAEEPTKPNEVPIKKDTINTIGNNETNRRVKENIESFLKNVSKSICGIKIEITKENKITNKDGKGFLLKFLVGQEMFYCLMFNEYMIDKDAINDHINITINYDNEFKISNIKLEEKERYFKSFTDIGLDITVIEIIEKDNIYKDYFLFPETEMPNNNLKYSKVYIPQYQKGNELKNARGKIIKIEKYEFTYLASTENDSSGSPIFLENSFKILGIHKESNEDKTENYADFISPTINIIENDIRKKRNIGKYENGKYIWEDGKYYIGEFKKNLPHGKGIKYYKNGNILYEGDFINGKFEGNGKYIYDDGDYFIGQYKNGLRNGKGIIFYKNGNMMFEGDYINDKIEGNGKYIWENGEYYIGQLKYCLRHGKGRQYDANGNILYEGDWINGKKEGNGKYIWENGNYYIGQFKNGLRNGKGIKYYSNGNIKYEGDYINDRREGNGKYIYENGEYYIGQFKKDLKHGKGKEYYSNGNIRYEGDYINDKFEGNGKYILENDEYYIGEFKSGLRHGKGKQYNANGNIMCEGYWINDKYVEK